MDKDSLETAFRSVCMEPVGRFQVHNREILVADGYSSNPDVELARFGVDPAAGLTDGCYVTTWVIADDDQKVKYGRPLFFSPLHDIESLTLPDRKRGRVNAALADAEQHIKAQENTNG